MPTPPSLRGGPCRPGGSDLRVPIPATGRCRYPDATIDCGGFTPQAHDASEPVVVFEVLSGSTRWFDQTKKVQDYQSLPSIRRYVLVAQGEPRVQVPARVGGLLVPVAGAVGLDAVIEIGQVPGPMRLADIYEGVFGG